MDAYLDIETTGLSPWNSDVTVVGVCRQDEDGLRMVQLVGSEITREAVERLLEGAETLYTYNGKRFDIAFLTCRLDIELPPALRHRDLMYDCWDRGLYGGLKVVEQRLGINRILRDVSGIQAVQLWWRYARWGDEAALAKLLAYNREDVMNLKVLRERLGVD